MPSVSVIIPNYNHCAFLKQRIDSVLNQTYENFEIIILDDFSTDHSKEIIEHYKLNPKIKQIIFNENNSGSPFKQWQKGIELATAEYIWIAESDDYCEASFLEIAVHKLNQNNSSIFFCESYNVDESDRIFGDYSWWTKDITSINWKKEFTMDTKDFIDRALKFKNVIVNASGVVFRRSEFDFKKIIKYKTCGDWLFWINLLLKSEKTITYSPNKLNYFRTHINTTRSSHTIKAQIQKVVEELSVKNELCKLGVIKKKEFKKYFFSRIDPFLLYFKIFEKNCFELDAPFFFIVLFVFRKFQIKIKIKSQCFSDD